MIQNDAARAILTKRPRTSAKPLLIELNWLDLEEKRKLHGEVLFHKIINGNAPKSLKEMLLKYEHSNNDARQVRRNNYYIPSYRTNAMAKSFFISTLKTWNKIPPEVRLTKESHNFKARLNTFYINQKRRHVNK